MAEMSVLFEEQPDRDLLDAFLEKAITNPFAKDKIKEDYLNAHPEVRFGIAEAIPNNYWSNQRDIFKNLQVPKFLAHGINDPLINLAYLEEIKVQNKQNCALKLFKDSGHYPMLEVPKYFEAYFIGITNKVFRQ
jgi:pimeloyl-ACP methyl ester carboxylesterase